MISDCLVPEVVVASLGDDRSDAALLARVQALLARALSVGVPTRPLSPKPAGVAPRHLRLRLSRRVIAAVEMSQRQRPRPVSTVANSA